MNKPVTHKQMYRRLFGGIVNRTLCRRVSHASDDANVGNTDADVTCKFCLRLMQNERLMERVNRETSEIEQAMKDEVDSLHAKRAA